MKVWESGRDVVLKRDTETFKRIELKQAWTSHALKRTIDDFWPDTTVPWVRMRSLCVSESSEDWQCGAFGPKGRVCKRLIDHNGKCNNLFLPADRKTLIRRLDIIKRQEHGEILGIHQKLSDAAVLRHSSKKLKDFLKKENVRHGSRRY